MHAADIGADEIVRPVDRPVDMRFGCEVENDIGLEVRDRPSHRVAVADIGLQEAVARIIADTAEAVEIGRIGQLVDVEHVVTTSDCVPNKRGSDESGSTSDQQLHTRPSRQAFT